MGNEFGYEDDQADICPKCEGGGIYMECYGGPPIEAKCESCGGTGKVEGEK